MELTTTMSHAAGPTIRLLLAHEDGLTRAGLRALLEREADVTVVGEVARGDDAVVGAGDLRADIVVMGLVGPGLDALKSTRLLVAGWACTRVVIVGSLGS